MFFPKLKVVSVGFIWLSLLLAVSFVFAQDGDTTIQYGETVTAQLRDPDNLSATYTFEGFEGDEIRLNFALQAPAGSFLRNGEFGCAINEWSPVATKQPVPVFNFGDSYYEDILLGSTDTFTIKVEADLYRGGIGCDVAITLTLLSAGDVDEDTFSGSADNCPTVANPDQADSDSDSLGDACDACPTEAGALTADGCPDTDGDTIADSADNCPADSNTDQTDFNTDGTGDACQDSDGDSVLDAVDSCPEETGSLHTAGCPDTDGDEIADSVDACPDEAGVASAEGCPDADADGIVDSKDNCPADENADQADFNADGVGDACQDSDSDTVKDGEDVCPDEAGSPAAEGCPDADGDKIADQNDACPNAVGTQATGGCPDQDGDQIADSDDNCPQTANPDQADFNADGSGDACQDTDSDNLLDSDDRCPTEAGVAELGGCADSDADTIEDSLDRCPYEAGTSEFAGCPDPKLLVFQGGWDFIKLPTWNADMTRILAARGKDIVIWDAQTGEELLTISQMSELDGVRWADNENHIESWGRGSYRIWDAQSGEIIEQIANNDHCQNKQWNADGSLVLSGSGNSVLVCSARTTDVLYSFSIPSMPVTGVDWNSDGRRILGWSYMGGIYVWNGATGAEEINITMEIVPTVLASWGTDANLIGAAWDVSGQYILGWNNAGAVIWDAEDGSVVFSYSSGEDTNINDAGWSPDGSRILIGTEQGNLLVLDAATGEVQLDMYSDGHESRIWRALWKLDGSLILTWGEYGFEDITYLRAWDAITGEQVMEYVLPMVGERPLHPIWSPDGSARFVTMSNIGVKLWSLTSEAPLLDLNSGSAYWRPDSTQIAVLSGNNMTIWDVAGDRDGDKWRDSKDNCPWIENSDQADSDQDHIGDLCDSCPEAAGPSALGGCPDTDGDQIIDADDQCPELAGTLDYAGCPDTDGDTLIDPDDQCPEVAGLLDYAGCPDTDEDTVPDPDDQCPRVAGLVDYAGCPDTDEDTVPDPDDKCPRLAGLVDYAGCPDTDGDTVPDPDDQCPDVVGLVDYAGCPDADGDTVPDPDDQCPDVAGLPELDGCMFTGTVTSNANLRAETSTQSEIVGQVSPPDAFMILGRNEAGDWLRVRILPQAEEEALEAWLFAQLVQTEAQIDQLPVIETTP